MESSSRRGRSCIEHSRMSLLAASIAFFGFSESVFGSPAPFMKNDEPNSLYYTVLFHNCHVYFPDIVKNEDATVAQSLMRARLKPLQASNTTWPVLVFVVEMSCAGSHQSEAYAFIAQFLAIEASIKARLRRSPVRPLMGGRYVTAMCIAERFEAWHLNVVRPSSVDIEENPVKEAGWQVATSRLATCARSLVPRRYG